jgi:response regulator RpfG family c-di-GMP phosphodiesterase
LLTGYAEIGATIDAINKGHIYRYLSKPWDDNDITLAIKLALQQQQLERDKLRLETLTRKQNAELKDLNANLEERVRVRTQQVRQTMASLEVVNEKLKHSFITSIRVFSNLIGLREGKLSGHSRHVAELSRTIAQGMGMNEEEVQDVFIAALLLDIGKIGLSDTLLAKPFSSLTQKERIELSQHPIKGQAALMSLEQLHGAAKLIRSQCERFDGLGYPEQLAGQDIPPGARILAMVNDYHAVQLGLLMPSHLSQADAIAFIQKWKGKRYDPSVVEAFMSVIAVKHDPAIISEELALKSKQLVSGMIVSRDLLEKNGRMLIAKDQVLNRQLIEQVMSFERMCGDFLTIHVQSQSVRG